MNKKRVGAVVLMAIGVTMILTSSYIQRQVVEGKGKVSKAQTTVKEGNSLFSLAPYGNEIGKHITGSAEKQIVEGEKQIRFYAQVASLLYIGAIVLMVIGLGILGFSFLKR